MDRFDEAHANVRALSVQVKCGHKSDKKLRLKATQKYADKGAQTNKSNFAKILTVYSSDM